MQVASCEKFPMTSMQSMVQLSIKALVNNKIPTKQQQYLSLEYPYDIKPRREDWAAAGFGDIGDG